MYSQRCSNDLILTRVLIKAFWGQSVQCMYPDQFQERGFSIAAPCTDVLISESGRFVFYSWMCSHRTTCYRISHSDPVATSPRLNVCPHPHAMLIRNLFYTIRGGLGKHVSSTGLVSVMSQSALITLHVSTSLSWIHGLKVVYRSPLFEYKLLGVQVLYISFVYLFYLFGACLVFMVYV